MSANTFAFNQLVSDMIQTMRNTTNYTVSTYEAERIYLKIIDNIHVFVNEYSNKPDKVIKLLVIFYNKAREFAIKTGSPVFKDTVKIITRNLESIGYSVSGQPLRRSTRH